MVPFEAFISHFRFVDECQGLSEKELISFIKEIINDNIDLCQKAFDYEKCKGCFASGERVKLDDVFRK